ncbi:MAG: DUF996 domain-containing protein [Thermoproteus sp.]
MLGVIFSLLVFIRDGPVLALAGLVIVLIAFKKLADVYNNGSIFKNALIAVIVDFIGGIIAIIALFLGILSLNPLRCILGHLQFAFQPYCGHSRVLDSPMGLHSGRDLFH